MNKEEMHAYRQGKIANRKTARTIDVLRATSRTLVAQCPAACAISRQIKQLSNALQRSEDSLAPIGSAIDRYIVLLDDDRQQLAAELYYLHFLTISQIAAEMGVSHCTASRLLHRATDKITAMDRD